MKIAVAQIKPETAEVAVNIQRHLVLVERAIALGAGLIVFPELSLTGYEPTLAGSLATTPEDKRLKDFQEISDQKSITIGVGMPTKHPEGTCISLIIFRPNQSLLIYSKKYLHPDEEPFFVSGENLKSIRVGETEVALAVCYEISIEEHTARVLSSGAKVYLASVAKSVKGINKAHHRLSEIAATQGITVLMANCTGVADGEQCAGCSAIWNDEGTLVDQLDETSEGILVWDTHSFSSHKVLLQ